MYVYTYMPNDVLWTGYWHCFMCVYVCVSTITYMRPGQRLRVSVYPPNKTPKLS